jgi:hypothetical protein
MRKGLIVLLSVGVLVGFGSGFARLAHRGYGGCQEGRWAEGRGGYRGYYGERFQREAAPVAVAAAPAPAPAAGNVYIVLPQAAAAAPIVVNGAAPAAAAPATVVIVPAASASAEAPPK